MMQSLPARGAWIETYMSHSLSDSHVAPRAGAWIETSWHVNPSPRHVAPRAGAWIETALHGADVHHVHSVAPRAGSVD